MPPEKEFLSKSLASASSGELRTMLTVISLFVMGTMGRILVSGEEFVWRVFLGEMLLAVVGAITLWSFGLLQEMSAPQMIMIGGLGGLGGVRFIEWIIKIARKVREAG
jgi:hypothetical protein